MDIVTGDLSSLVALYKVFAQCNDHLSYHIYTAQYQCDDYKLLHEATWCGVTNAAIVDDRTTPLAKGGGWTILN